MRSYLLWSAALTALFLATYSTTNYLAAGRTARYRLYSNWELGLPFLPWMIYAYCSVNAFLTLPLFVLRRRAISRFAAAFAGLTVAGSALHWLLPTELGWPHLAAVSGYPLFGLFYQLDQPHNLVPSFHVAYSCLAAGVLWRDGGTKLRGLAVAWCLLLSASVVLVHRHHLFDVATGAVFGAAAYRWFARKRSV